MISDGLFREDLLYRINTITIDLPPLRERGNDILLLAEYYLHKYTLKYDKPGLKLDQNAQKKLLQYNWPGNVRELQHSMEKAVILADTDSIGKHSFTLSGANTIQKFDLQNKTLEEMETEMILASIEKERGNLSAVAKKLGITRPTLYNKLKKIDN
jgi:transcriptional regulator with PAS, ATPase and Fis domain